MNPKNPNNRPSKKDDLNNDLLVVVSFFLKYLLYNKRHTYENTSDTNGIDKTIKPIIAKIALAISGS